MDGELDDPRLGHKAGSGVVTFMSKPSSTWKATRRRGCLMELDVEQEEAQGRARQAGQHLEGTCPSGWRSGLAELVVPRRAACTMILCAHMVPHEWPPLPTVTHEMTVKLTGNESHCPQAGT